MSQSLKDRIKADLSQAQSEGTLRAEQIKNIVKAALTEASLEFNVNSEEVQIAAKDAVDAVVSVLETKGGDLKAEIVASVEGAIEAIAQSRHSEIARMQSEIRRLQAQVDAEEVQVQEEVSHILSEIQTSNQSQSMRIQDAIRFAVHQIIDSEEAALLRKRYAQLKAQLAILQASLMERYGNLSHTDIQQYLDDAKVWYERARDEPEVLSDPVKQRYSEFERRFREVAIAIAQKEHQVKQKLSALWRSLPELFQD